MGQIIEKWLIKFFEKVAEDPIAANIERRKFRHLTIIILSIITLKVDEKKISQSSFTILPLTSFV